MSFRGFLKADTLVKIKAGPVVAVGDGFTPITNLDLSTADVAEAFKHDSAGVTDESGALFAAIANAAGYYNWTLTATVLDTEGMLSLLVNDTSLCLPIRDDYMVVNANVYDSLYAAATTDYLQVDTIQVTGTGQTANDNGADINAILVDTGSTLDALIKDVPTVAEFEARTIVSADYVVVGDTIARVTLVDTTTANSDLVTASAIKTAIEADGGDLSSIMEALVNKMIITEANGNAEMFNDASASQGSVASAFTSVAGETIRLRMFK